jgi:hypothetical protein
MTVDDPDIATEITMTMVITTRDIVNAPQFEVVITRWNVAPALNESQFSFTPPKGARKVGFVPL